jgi:phosphoadenosine phosphosulfate reductase
LRKRGGVKFDAHYELTTVDPPELIYFIRKNYPDVTVEHSGTTMWKLIVKKQSPPTRLARFCCEKLKEQGGSGRMVVTGVRWAESVKRKNNRAAFELLGISSSANKKLMNDNDEARRIFETCAKPEKNKRIVNPIIDWLDEDVWEYIRNRKIKYCRLYDEGFKRLGCIGCPMAGPKGMERAFARWPKYKDAYLRAFTKMLDVMKARKGEDWKETTKWTSPEAVMEWWIHGNKDDVEELDGQIDIEE